MKQLTKLGFFILLLTQLTSCSSFMRNTGLGVFGDILSKAAPEIERSRSWEFFEESIASQLMMIESLGSLKKDDPLFQFSMIQGNAAYAFTVWDTLYLEDFINLKDESEFKQRAIYHYSRAVEVGSWYLKANDLSVKELIKSKDPKSLLAQKLSHDEIDRKIVLFLAQSMAALMNLNKKQTSYLIAIPTVKAMFDWVCESDPNIYNGTCSIFYGAYEASRPRMLGGNPEKAKDIFLEAIKRYPHNLLVRLSYVQYYLIPSGNEDGFKEQMEFLALKQREFRAQRTWNPAGENTPVKGYNDRLNLFNATALKRYEILKKNQSEIF